MPDIGDFKDVAVIELLAKVGDTVTVEQSLFTVESDKASMEIPSPAAGAIMELTVQGGRQGQHRRPGGRCAWKGLPQLQRRPHRPPLPGGCCSARCGTPAPHPHRLPAAATAAAAAAVPAHNPRRACGRLPHASPSVRKFARELGVPLAEVKGTGPKGRITPDDIQNFTKAVMAVAAQTQAQAAKAPAAAGAAGGGEGLNLLPWPKVDFAKFGPVERKDLSRIKKISGANLHRNWVMIPHVTNNDDADITDLEAFRVRTTRKTRRAT